MRITMDAEGRLAIPAEIREEAGLRSGVPLEVRVRDGKVEIEAAAAAGVRPERTRSLSLIRGKPRTADESTSPGQGERPQLDLLIRMAIAHRRLVELEYASRRRQVEPHDYGLRNGERQLLVYQRSGPSSTGEAKGWRSLKLVSISDFKVLDETFSGARPAERPIAWDRLFASVSRQVSGA